MYKYELNKDNKDIAQAVESIKDNGGYCPCKVLKNEDTKCICKEFKDEKTDCVCSCGIYSKRRIK